MEEEGNPFPCVSRSAPPSDQVAANPATTSSNQSTPTRMQPPGTTLSLIDDEADEVDLSQHQASPPNSEFTATETSSTAPGRRYPARTNCRRPLRFRDGAVDDDRHT